MNSKRIRVSALVLLFLVAVNALVAGYLLITDPSGKSMGMSLDLLRYTRFNNFLIPGISLFVINGLMGLLTIASLVLRWPHYPVWLSVQGILLAGWIAIQVLLIREFNFLHMLMIIIAAFFILSATFFMKPAKL